MTNLERYDILVKRIRFKMNCRQIKYCEGCPYYQEQGKDCAEEDIESLISILTDPDFNLVVFGEREAEA